MPTPLRHLPHPPPEACAVSERLQARIRAELETRGGWLPFARYMELALYAPGLGYYSAGSAKLGSDGDFVTAPEISSLYARCLARQVAQLVEAGVREIVEIGAGSGALACDVLDALEKLDRVPERYRILEVSAELRERQAARLAGRLTRVEWLDVLPQAVEATVIANEVLDAMPVHIVRTRGTAIDELGIVVSAGESPFERAWRPASDEVLREARALVLPDGYETEIHLAARGFVSSLGRVLTRGVILIVDYGFPAHEYYHPQRARGTLMCHYRHHAHDDALALIGLQDITAHVDFTAIARAGVDAGLHVLGFATQAQFLVNAGLATIMSETSPAELTAYAPLAAAAQKLTSPAEMGELFKVLALGRDIPLPLAGFARGDRTHRL